MQFDGTFEHVFGLIEVFAHIDPAIAKIVHDIGLIGFKFERLEEVGLGLWPVSGALIGNAAPIEQTPADSIRAAQTFNRPVIGIGRPGKVLIDAQDIAKLDQGIGTVAAFIDHGFEQGNRIVGLAKLFIACRSTQARVPAMRGVFGDRLIDNDGCVKALLDFHDLADQKAGDVITGAQ